MQKVKELFNRILEFLQPALQNAECRISTPEWFLQKNSNLACEFLFQNIFFFGKGFSKVKEIMIISYYHGYALNSLFVCNAS